MKQPTHTPAKDEFIQRILSSAGEIQRVEPSPWLTTHVLARLSDTSSAPVAVRLQLATLAAMLLLVIFNVALIRGHVRNPQHTDTVTTLLDEYQLNTSGAWSTNN